MRCKSCWNNSMKGSPQAVSPYGMAANAPAGMTSAGLPTGVPAGTPMNPFPMGFQGGGNGFQMTCVPQAQGVQPMSLMPAATAGAGIGIGNGAGCQMAGAQQGGQQGGQPLTTVDSIMFTPGYLRTQIGRVMRVEFLIGNNMLVDRMGTLVAVGASYIILREIEQDDLLLCDIYSIKFVRIYY